MQLSLMINFQSLSLILILLFLVKCSDGLWSAGSVIYNDARNPGSSLLPLSIEGRGSMRLISGGSSDPNTPVVSFYQSELVGGVTLWSQQASLLPADSITTGTSSGFGSSFDLDQDIILVGSRQYGGSAYIFQGSWTKWSQQQKLEASDSDSVTREFGYSVGIYGNFALITASKDDDKGSSAGSVYAFVSEKSKRRLDSSDATVGYSYSTRGSWSQVQKLYAKDVMSGDNFGYQVAISEGTAVIGSPYSGNNGGTNIGQGAVYVFTLNEIYGTWSQQQRLCPLLTIADGAGVGQNIAFYDKTIIISSTIETVSGSPKVGSVFVYHYTSRYKYSLSQTIVPPTGDYAGIDFFLFGSGISLYDKSLMVGASSYDNFNGAVYSYYYNGHSFSQQQRLSGVNPYIYGMSAFVTVNQPSANYYTGDFNWSCVVVSLGDQFGDGWDTAKLVISAPDGTSDTYAPYCDTRNPFQFRYCPTLPSDSGVYTFSIPNAPKSKYFWEIYWTVTEESTGKVHYGDHATQLSFDFNEATTAFTLSSAKHVVPNNQTCKVCPPKPKPPPKAVPPTVVVTPGNAAKSAPVPAKVAPVHIASPKLFRSRKLLTDSPTAEPTAEPTFEPTTPTLEPTSEPTTPTAEPTSEPTAFPTNTPSVQPTSSPTTSGQVSFPWFKLNDAAGDGWYEADGTGTSYYISDTNGGKLVSTGTLCGDSFSSECWQVIPDGTFILRVGGGLDADSGDHTWDFCGKTGGSQRQLLFSVSHGECTPLQVLTRSTICSTSIEARVKLLGEVLFTGLDYDVELTSGDSQLVSKVITTLGTVLKATDVSITSTSYSSSLGGHLLSFSCYVNGDSLGYDGRDYYQVQAIQEEISSEFSTAISSGQFLSSVVSTSDVSTKDSNSLKFATGVSLISLSVNEVDYIEKHSTEVENANMKSSTTEKNENTSEPFMATNEGLYTMFGIAAGLVLAVGLAVFTATKLNSYKSLSSRQSEKQMDESVAAQLLQNHSEKEVMEVNSSITITSLVKDTTPYSAITTTTTSTHDLEMVAVEQGQEKLQWEVEATAVEGDQQESVEVMEGATGTTYSSNLFLVGKPVKGEMTFSNNTNLSQDDQPVDLWLGMKKFVNDEDALLNNYSGRR